MNRDVKGFLMMTGAVLTAAVIINWFTDKKAAQATTAAQNA